MNDFETGLRGRTVLVIAGGDVSKRSTWESARAHGIRVILVESRWPLPAEVGLGSEIVDFIHIPALHENHTDEAEMAHCEEILRQLEQKSLRPDGVITFWDETPVLAALLAERLGLRANSVAAQRRAKSKFATYRALAIHAPKLAVPFIGLRAPADVHSAEAQKIIYPALVKWCHGAGAVGTTIVESPADAEREAAKLMELIADFKLGARQFPGWCFQYSHSEASVVLMQFIVGSEHDVDLLLFNGELIDAVVTDNANLPPICAETAALMPSALPGHEQETLIAGAYEACKALGLTDGAINAELMLSPAGPKVVEINARMGGVYISTWIKEIWGFDLPAAAFMIACGIRPSARTHVMPQCHIAGVTCFPEDGSSLQANLGDRAHEVMYKLGSTGPATCPVRSVGFRGDSAENAVAEATMRLPALFAKNPLRAQVLMQQLSTLAKCPLPTAIEEQNP